MLSQSHKQRYLRAINLPNVGEEGQLKLLGASVLIVGVGAIGSITSTYLTAAGVGRIGLIDFDTIDIEDFSYYLTQISFQWEIINNLLIVGSAGTDSERIWIGNIGLEYTLFDAFFLRAGMRTDPLSPSLGVGYLFSVFAIDAATIYHPVLGMSVGVGLSFTF